MRFKITWTTDYEFSGYRNSPDDPRPSEIEADKYEVFYAEGNNAYPMGLQFIKDGANIVTFFVLPIAVTVIADLPE